MAIPGDAPTASRRLPATGRDSLERLQLRRHLGQCFAQRLDRFTQATFQCSANGRQRAVGNRRLGAELEHLPTPRTQRQQAAEALRPRRPRPLSPSRRTRISPAKPCANSLSALAGRASGHGH